MIVIIISALIIIFRFSVSLSHSCFFGRLNSKFATIEGFWVKFLKSQSEINKRFYFC
jgi:hypothetical protein